MTVANEMDIDGGDVTRDFAQQHHALLQRMRSTLSNDEIARVPVLLRAAVDAERLDMLQAVFDSGPQQLEFVMQYAIDGGHLDIVRWLHETVEQEIDTNGMSAAAMFGHLSVLRYFLDDSPPARYSHIELAWPAMNAAAEEGRLDIVKCLHEEYGMGCIWMDIDSAATNGHLPVVQFMVERFPQEYMTSVMQFAAANGHVEVVKYLLAHPGLVNDVNSSLRQAIREGRMEVVELLVECAELGPRDGRLISAISDAAENGHVHVLEFVHRVFPRMVSALPSLDGAAIKGHLDVVRLLASLRSTECPPETIETVAGYGHVHVLEFLNQQCAPEYTVKAMNQAAGHGHLETVRFLYERVTSSVVNAVDTPEADDWLKVCSTGGAMCRATRHGHLEVLKYLHSQGTKVCQCDCVYRAAASGHLATVAFVMKRRDSPWSSKIPQICATKMVSEGHVDVLRYLHQHHRRLRFHSYAMAKAATNGHLETIKFVHKHQLAQCTPSAITGAATSGHLDVIKFLHENNADGFTTSAMDAAAAGGHLGIVKFLHENRTEGCTTAAMDEAASGGHLHVVKYLHTNRHEGCTRNAVGRAALFGRVHTLRYLYEHRTERCPFALERAAERGGLAVVKFLCEQGTTDHAREALQAANRCSKQRVARYLLDRFPHLATVTA